MPNRTDIDDLVDRLSEDERNAICGVFTFASFIEADIGEALLIRLGLWDENSNLTDLGHSVRSALLEARDL